MPESLWISRLGFRFLSLALVCFSSGDKSKMKSCFPHSGKAISNNGKSAVLGQGAGAWRPGFPAKPVLRLAGHSRLGLCGTTWKSTGTEPVYVQIIPSGTVALLPFGSAVSLSLTFFGHKASLPGVKSWNTSLHKQEEEFSVRLVWDNKWFSHYNLICAPGPPPSRDSIHGCLCLSPHCGGTTASHPGPRVFPDVWRRLLCPGGTLPCTPWAGRTWPGHGQVGSGLGTGWISAGNGD